MDKIISAIRTLIEGSISTSGSVLSDIKKVYFGDPIQIPTICQPAITIAPISTEMRNRGPGGVEKVFSIDIKLIYNQRQYYQQGNSSIVTASAVFDNGYQEIQIHKAAHGVKIGDSIVLQATPSSFSGTFAVSQVISSDIFAVSKISTEITQVLNSVSYQKVDTENIFAVVDSISKMEGEDESTGHPRSDTITGIIVSNPTLTTSTGCHADIASIKTIDYSFSTDRGFPTYEVSVRVEATRVYKRPLYI